MRENYIDRFIMIDIEKFVTITNANGYVNDDFKRFIRNEKTISYNWKKIIVYLKSMR
jgi:hypothetical protein